MYVEAIAYLISTRTPLQGFFPLSTSQFYIWERGKSIVRVQYLTQEHNGWSLLGDKIGLLNHSASMPPPLILMIWAEFTYCPALYPPYGHNLTQGNRYNIV